MIELLAPAKDLETLMFDFMYGADAVYIGGREYSLRANATNFSIDEMIEAVNYAHKLNKKVYVTINIIFHNNDYIGLKEYILKLNAIGIDAVIVSDIGALSLIKKIAPTMEIHLSTQASCMNIETIKFYKNLGVKRVVLARECNKKDIKKMTELIDIETFIHGAMCSSISGRCVLSNYMTFRDSNRGGCAQICRWDFDLLDSNKENLQNETKFTMCSKDLIMLDNISDMINIGIRSFKIEGRMRSIYYVATILSVYREAIDKYLNRKDVDLEYYRKVLNRCSNRENVSQFYNGENSVNEQYYLGREEYTNKDFLGLILDCNNGIITLEQRNYFKIGDDVQIFGPKTKLIDLHIDNMYDEDMNELDIARHPRQIIKIKSDIKVEKNDFLRIKI